MQRSRRLRPSARLRSKSDFDALFASGVRVHGELLTIVGRRTEQALRFGVPCGKRFSKRAVDRNRFRRVAREVVRTRCQDPAPRLEFVILPRCKPGDVDFARFAVEIPALLEKLERKLSRAPLDAEKGKA
jgi:ribonuclease P protein component